MLENKSSAFRDCLITTTTLQFILQISLFPIFLFLSVIWFTSKLANDTEIIAILSSGNFVHSFFKALYYWRFNSFYFCFIDGFFCRSQVLSEGFNNFRYTYLRGGGKEAMRGITNDVYRQISDDEFIYVNSFNTESKTAFNFSLEKFKK